MDPALTNIDTYLSTKYPDLDQTEIQLFDWFYSSTETHPAFLTFWRSILLDTHLNGHISIPHSHLAIDATQLCHAFYHEKFGQPTTSSLTLLLNDLIDAGDILPLHVFEKVFATGSWWSRLYSHVSTLTRWTHAANEPYAIPLALTSKSMYIVLPSLQAIALSILDHYWSQGLYANTTDQVLTFEEFQSKYAQFRGYTLTQHDLWLVLKYMQHQCGLALDVNVQGYGQSYTLIKFPDQPGSSDRLLYFQHLQQSSSLPKHVRLEPAQITQHDRAVLGLKTTCQALQNQVTELQMKMDEYIRLSLDHASKKQKLQALYALKRKKQLGLVLDRRLASLETIETLLLKIDTFQNDVQIMQAFNMGVATLRQILDIQDLQVDQVDRTMDSVQDVLEDQQRVESVITSGLKDINDTTNEPITTSSAPAFFPWQPWLTTDDNLQVPSPPLKKEKRSRESIEADALGYPTPVSSQEPHSRPERSNSELARLHTILANLQVPEGSPKAKRRQLADPLLS
ncbi:hypothetical protein DM01DRAFT_1333033 [Hesseltinella vesiculosa]|uniref:Vacuolar-sorting protein SNF7 n=1 Tax=Hesseltinella vesiculosa TaxID=101127 RepID=A0A1X2GQZ6_9FUNG|nr:hypothetical protein DM01DRAFT_1333033 [Hesseltinella vesiculosa]